MKPKHLSLLCDPETYEEFQLVDPEYDGKEIVSGTLRSPSNAYSITNGIPRFVSDEGYSDNFGYQWNRWARVQFEDQNVGGPMQNHTTNMFVSITQFSAEKLRGKTMLDMGCGPGRFTDVAVKMGASVIALDYSSAIDAAKANFIGNNADILFVQGDALRLPIKTDSVDFSFTIGVLHHTPSPATGVREAFRVTRAGGAVCLARLCGQRVLHLLHGSLLARCLPGAEAGIQALPTFGVFVSVWHAGLCAWQNLAAAELPAEGGVSHRMAARLSLDHSGYFRRCGHHLSERIHPQ